MTRPFCPLCRVPLDAEGRCRSCYEHETGLCASHGQLREACSRCLDVGAPGLGPRRAARLRQLLGIGVGTRELREEAAREEAAP